MPNLSTEYESISQIPGKYKDSSQSFMQNYDQLKIQGALGTSAKLQDAQTKVEEVTLTMQNNVRNMLNNQKDFSLIEGKSEDLKSTAFNMKNNAK